MVQACSSYWLVSQLVSHIYAAQIVSMATAPHPFAKMSPLQCYSMLLTVLGTRIGAWGTS